MSDFGSISDIRFFSVYDESTRELKYCKKNFNFELYKNDFDLEGKTHLQIFDHFLIANETAFFIEPDFLNKGDKTPSYLKPTTLKSEFEKYFFPMNNVIINHNNAYAYTAHSGYMNVQDPITYVSITQLVRQQFELIFYKDNQVRRLQDYYYSDNEGIYSKYNFDFEKYSNDFKVYGNNLVIFTDVISRIIYSSGTYLGIYGNGVPRGFKQYFIQSDGLIDYMSKYGTTSIYKNVAYKNENSIDYLEYAKTMNLGDVSERDAREHYIRWGQFTQVELKFIEKPITNVQRNLNSICNIYASRNGAGFLYKNGSNPDDENIYVVTCDHLLGNDNLTSFFASFNTVDNTRTNTSTTAEFRVLGRDRFTDILVGVFDPELEYNKTFAPDLSPYKKLNISLTSDYTIGEKVYTVGNISSLDNNAYLSGNIMDPKFAGDFGINATYIPESLLIDIKSEVGLSGAPLFKENDDTKVVGMLVGAIMDKKYAVSVTSFLFENLVINLIARYNAFKDIYKNNPTLLALNTDKAINRRWLGCTTSYYHPSISPSRHPSLRSYPETGGLILHDFILGFDYINKKFIFDTDTLTREGVTKMDCPLLQSKMYKKFIDSGKAPIVLKSAAFTQGWIGQFAKYEFGKFSNQDAYYNFTYGWSGLGSKPVPEGVADNALVVILGKIYFEYYYFNGQKWILDFEELNDDYSEDFYTVYTNNLGQRFYESKWSYPPILYTYDKPYPLKIMKNSDISGSVFIGHDMECESLTTWGGGDGAGRAGLTSWGGSGGAGQAGLTSWGGSGGAGRAGLTSWGGSGGAGRAGLT